MNTQNRTAASIIKNMLLAAVSLFINGFGVYLTIRADIGAAPWDVFNLGLSGTFGILYGTASIAVSLSILIIDIILREPIGIAIIIDSITVGKSVDFFNYIDIIPTPSTLAAKILMMLAGLLVIGYTQFFYMHASLGCGPRDTLLVGIKRRMKKIPIGVVGVVLQSAVTGAGFLLGGPVGIGTLICAFGAAPIMQFAFYSVHFDAVGIKHQSISETLKILFKIKKTKEI